MVNLRKVRDGFRFELALEPNFRANGPDLLGIANLAPGDYLVENYGGVFTIKPLIPAQLSLEVHWPTAETTATSAWVIVRNSGLADALDVTLVTEILQSDRGTVDQGRQPVSALAGQEKRVLVRIPPVLMKGMTLRARLEDGDGRTLAETAFPQERDPDNQGLAQRILELSSPGGRWLGGMISLILFATLPVAALLVHRAARDDR